MSTSRQTGALLLIDFQNDFLRRPGLEPHRDTLVSNAAAWLEMFRSQNLPIAFIQTILDPMKEERMPHWKDRGIRQCLRGTEGAAPPSILQPKSGEDILEKQGFLLPDPDPLIDWAKEQAGGQVLIAGLMTHACVYHHVAALLSAGIEVELADGALASDSPAFAAHTLNYLNNKGVKIRSAHQWMSQTNSHVVPPMLRPKCIPSWEETNNRLKQWAKHLEDSQDSLADLITREVRKPIDLAIEEIQTAVQQIHDTCKRRDAFQRQCGCAEATTLRVPLGNILSITPWNNPASIPVGRIAPAVAYGNSVCWKPSPAALTVSRKIMELAELAGIDDTLLECVEGGADTAQELLKNSSINAVTFSGSLANGRRVLALAAERLLPCQLELGGNNAAVITGNADLKVAARLIAAAAFEFAGQRCTANRRVILLSGAYDEFRDLLFAEIQSILVADPLMPGTRFGPMQSAHSAARIEDLLARTSLSAKVTRFHEKHCQRMGEGWCAPAVVEDAASDSAILWEESFGPVLVLQKADSLKDGIQLLNAVSQGLVAALFSNALVEWKIFCREVKAGTLKWNVATAGAARDLPFGGWKLSGYGSAEHGIADEEFFTRHQTHLKPQPTPPTL